MNEIKIIICDLDGTLLNEEEMMSELTINTIKKLKENGYLFGYATGRPICSIENLMEKWQMNKDIVDIVIGLNGGHIKDYRLNREEKCFQIDGKLIEKIITHFQGFPVNFGVYKDDYLAVFKDDDLAKRLATSDNIPYIVENFQDIYKSKQSKLIVITHPSDMKYIREHGQKLNHPHFKSLQAGQIEYEYMDPQLSKSLGLELVCSWHDLSLKNLLAFGDADNDAEMIRDAGIGVAMENASTLTKSYANYITGSHQNDGVAYFLLEKILGGNI